MRCWLCLCCTSATPRRPHKSQTRISRNVLECTGIHINTHNNTHIRIVFEQAAVAQAREHDNLCVLNIVAHVVRPMCLRALTKAWPSTVRTTIWLMLGGGCSTRPCTRAHTSSATGQLINSNADYAMTLGHHNRAGWLGSGEQPNCTFEIHFWIDAQRQLFPLCK